MKLKGAEKEFWWLFKRITDSKNIPSELPGYTSIDSCTDDEEMAVLTARVTVMGSIYLKETLVTDEGVKSISRLKSLKRLTLMKHQGITKACLPYINKLTDLEYLDLWRTQIRMEDITALNNLKNLKELYVSTCNEEDERDESSEQVLEKIIKAEETLPGCKIYNYYQ